MQMNLTLHKLKKRALYTVSILSDWAMFIGIVMIGGLGSSWYMVSAGSGFTTNHIGPWVIWTSEGRADADPYTRAHFARSGRLNMSTEIAGTYIARTDASGIRLHSSCEYHIEGADIDASWWSLSAFDEHGQLIPNPSQRYTYTSDTVALSPDGSFVITLARDARPGNWLPTGGAGRLALVLHTLEGANAMSNSGEIDDQITLPTIKTVACR